MGQSHGKFSVPHQHGTTPKEANLVENGNPDVNFVGEKVNGVEHVATEQDNSVVGKNEQKLPEGEEPVTNGDVHTPHHNTLLSKCKHRAASWKSMTLNFVHSPLKHSSGKEPTSPATTDENNNVESNAETKTETGEIEKVNESGDSVVEETKSTPSKVKKPKHSFRQKLMQRASSLTHKKNKNVDKNNNEEVESPAKENVEAQITEKEAVETKTSNDQEAASPAISEPTSQTESPVVNLNENQKQNLAFQSERTFLSHAKLVNFSRKLLKENKLQQNSGRARDQGAGAVRKPYEMQRRIIWKTYPRRDQPDHQRACHIDR